MGEISHLHPNGGIHKAMKVVEKLSQEPSLNLNNVKVKTEALSLTNILTDNLF